MLSIYECVLKLNLLSCLSLCDIDSNEIDNSYAVAAAAAAAEVEAADDGGDADTDTDADDVERVADDYVMALGQQGRSNNKNNATRDRTVPPKVAKAQATPTTAVAATTTATTAQLMNAKTQDLLSLSQLGSSYQASTARAPSHHEKSSASSMKNAISAGSAASSPGSTFQQIGSQRINANVLVEAAATTTATMSAESSSSHHHHHGQQQQVEVGTPTQSTSNIRTSARKVDSKFQLPKQQKTDAPMLNYIFDTHSSANKHHHHDQRWVTVTKFKHSNLI